MKSMQLPSVAIFFYDLFSQGQGGMAPLGPPWICYWVQFPLEANFLLTLIYHSLRSNTKMTTLPTLYIAGKLKKMYSLTSCLFAHHT